jgi:PAS domain S-box-containing protein
MTSLRSLIEAERNKLRSVLNAMTDGVFALDHAGRIILFNKAASELTGRTIAEVAGQLAEKVMPFRSHGELIMTRWLASVPGTEHKIGQWKGLELYRADGSSLYVDVQAVTLKDDPNGIAALVTFHDLTKAHQLEEMKVDFVALAAHELRTPLTEIKGYLDILRTKPKACPKPTATSSSAASTQRQPAFRPHAQPPQCQPHRARRARLPSPAPRLPDFITEVDRRAARPRHPAAPQIKLALPPPALQIIADATALREVIVNLVENAINHTAQHRRDHHHRHAPPERPRDRNLRQPIMAPASRPTPSRTSSPSFSGSTK